MDRLINSMREAYGKLNFKDWNNQRRHFVKLSIDDM